jgi:hypothetical protein
MGGRDLTVYYNSLLKARLSGVTDQEKDIDETYESDLAVPSRAIHKYVPRMNVARGI